MRPLGDRLRAWSAAAREAPARVGGIVREIDAAAAAYQAPRRRVGARAVRLWRRGWHLGDAAYMGLLDPVHGSAVERMAVRPGELTRLQEELNPPEAVPAAEDKRRYAEVCARAGLPAPGLVAVLERRGGRAQTIHSWAALLQRDAPEEVVVKPAEGHRGLGVRVLRRGPDGVAIDHRGTRMSWTTLAAALAAEPWEAFVVQPRLHPHVALRELSGRDVLQTMRVVTLRDESGGVRVLFTWLRVAVGDHPVDSFRGGSTRNAIAIVSPAGVTTSAYRVAASGFGLEPLAVHPETGADLVGFTIPAWDQAMELVTRAAAVFAPLRAVGWDVAVTDAGPVMVEANAWWAVASTPAGDTLPVLAALRDAARPQSRATA